MKLSRSKKIILSGLIATTGLGIATAVAIPNLTAHQTSINTSNDGTTSSNGGSTSTGSSSASGKVQTTLTSSQSYSFSLMSDTTSVDPAGATYTLKINSYENREGKVYLMNKDGELVDSIQFKPGEKITVQMVLNKGFETYTVRDLNITGADPSIFIPSKNVKSNPNRFEVQMPNYADTVNPLTGKSDVYVPGTNFTIRPTFIQESIGVEDNKVDWQHGAFADSLNGYVYDLSGDMTWSSLKGKLYETFENKEITNPIDVYIYLHGHDLTFDQKEIDLGIQSGWAIHIYNNKTDSKEKNSTGDGYGEIKVPANMEAHVGVKGSIALGSGVKYKFVPWSDGIAFISYNDTRWIGYQSNDPVQRLGA